MTANGNSGTQSSTALDTVKVIVGLLTALFGVLFTAFVFWLPYHDEGTFTPVIIVLMLFGLLIVASGTWTFLRNR